MTDAVESRAAIIHDYVLSAEEYMAAFAALGSEVRNLAARSASAAQNTNDLISRFRIGVESLQKLYKEAAGRTDCNDCLANQQRRLIIRDRFQSAFIKYSR